jgi:hypothetical protein
MSSGNPDYSTILKRTFLKAEHGFLTDRAPQVPIEIQQACDIVFASKTQAFREVLLGCLLTRICDKNKDIRLPYVDLGPNAFSGRSLDEQVVNPFLHEKKIPSTRGPYLSVFRRQVKFNETTKAGLRDKRGYDAFLRLLRIIERIADQKRLLRILEYVLYRFILVREQAKIELVKLERISLTQFDHLIDGLLRKPSGGFFPFLLVLAMAETVVHRFSLHWQIQYQGINVADRASGVGGDITIRSQDKPLLTIEVTERPVDAPRVQATFKDKIAAGGLTDYVFMVHLHKIGEASKKQAEKYFVHGYDVNFVDIQKWLTNTLVTVGASGRKYFQERIIHHLSSQQVQKALKLAWNEVIEDLTD